MPKILEVSTDNNLKYHSFPITSGFVEFKIKAANDAHISLTMGPQESDPMYEVGVLDLKSVIRRNRCKPEKAEIDTPNILNGGEFRGFWIRWDGGIISAGREGESIPFISWTDPEPFPISYVGVCTGWGASGTWKIEGPSAGLYSLLPGQCSPFPVALVPGAGGASGLLVDASSGKVPPGAVVAGKDCSGEALYVARAHHKGALTPGKLVGSHGCVYVPWGGDEHLKTEYQVLVGDSYKWMPSSSSNIPSGLLSAGQSEYGEPLFVGRVHHEGTVTNGKVQKSHGVCYIPFNGKELAFPNKYFEDALAHLCSMLFIFLSRCAWLILYCTAYCRFVVMYHTMLASLYFY